MDKTTDFGSIARRNPLKLLGESTDKVVSLDAWKEMRDLAEISRKLNGSANSGSLLAIVKEQRERDLLSAK
ncbi:MAG: hypothetical protein IPJ71_02015 [Bdellovibrionales bacterium]|nr:hypothetical protein [Bdellovibrionales bacterium]